MKFAKKQMNAAFALPAVTRWTCSFEVDAGWQVIFSAETEALYRRIRKELIRIAVLSMGLDELAHLNLKKGSSNIS
jgi:hypothetical protein